MHTIINILEINQKKKNFTERNPPYIMNRIYGIFLLDWRCHEHKFHLTFMLCLLCV